MNTSLVSQLQEDYLRCKICFQPFTSPKALPPCLHTYCENCLRGYIYSRNYDRAGSFPCPECRREVEIPDGGVACFPDNHMVVSLQDTVAQSGLDDSVLSDRSPQPSAPPPAPTNNTTNNVNLNLNYQGTISVNNTHNQTGERTVRPQPTQTGDRPPRPVRPQPTQMVDALSCRTLVSPPASSRTPRRSTSSLRSPGTPASTPTPRLYPVLPTSVTELSVPEPQTPVRRETGPRRPAPPPPPVRPRAVDLPPAAIPVVYNRFGAILCFGQFGNGLTDFTTPIGMVISPHGYVVVSDQKDNRIMIFEKLGKLRSILSTDGKIQDIAMNSKGHIVCANTKIANALAISYDMNGKVVSTYGNHYTHEKPHGIAVTRRDNLIVSTLETKLVYCLSDEGRMLQKFKAKSRDGLGLNKPLYVATNFNEDMIVSDEGNNCVRVFNKIGGLKFQIGGKPSHKLGSLRHPRGVATDPKGNIIVADSGNHRVQLFNSSGKFLDVLVEIKREGPGCELKPQNVAVQGDKMVVMVVGPQFAQLRVFSYHPDTAKYHPCACQ